MPATLEEIIKHEERLQAEIVERECLLAALKILHNYSASGKSAPATDLGIFESIVALAPPEIRLLKAATKPDPAPLAPALPPAKPYMHPELKVIGSGYGTVGKAVWWAIQRMTDDYSLQDIAVLLKREGYWIKASEISVALTRFKGRGKIEEVASGRGRRASIFRKPESATYPETDSINPIRDTISTAVLAATP